MHLIADGDIGRRIANGVRQPCALQKSVRRRDEFRAERVEPGAHHGIVPRMARHSRTLRDQRAMEHEILSTWTEARAAIPAPHREPRHARSVSFFKATTVSSHIVEMLFPGAVQHHGIRLDLPRTMLSTLSLMARQLGTPGMSALKRRYAGRGGELRDGEIPRLLRLAQARQQGGGSRIAPDQNERPPIALDTTIGKISLLLRSSRHW